MNKATEVRKSSRSQQMIQILIILKSNKTRINIGTPVTNIKYNDNKFTSQFKKKKKNHLSTQYSCQAHTSETIPYIFINNSELPHQLQLTPVPIAYHLISFVVSLKIKEHFQIPKCFCHKLHDHSVYYWQHIYRLLFFFF